MEQHRNSGKIYADQLSKFLPEDETESSIRNVFRLKVEDG
jgi:hypothetical protein